MQEEDYDFGVTNEDTEILNLPLCTERKADGIYRYRRRVPKALLGRVGKGYFYLRLGWSRTTSPRHQIPKNHAVNP